MHYPLILTIRVEGAINLVRLAHMLFAFRREAPIALTLHRAIMQLRAQPCPSLCTNEGQGFSAFVFHSPRIFRRARALCRLTKRCPQLTTGGKSRACNLQLVFIGKKEESGLLVKMSSQTSGGGSCSQATHDQGFQTFHYVSCSGAVSIRVA